MTLFPVQKSDFSDVFGRHPVFDAMLVWEDGQAHGILADVAVLRAAVEGKEHEFLSPGEVARWKTIKAKTYRDCWLAGRLCAKVLRTRHLSDDERRTTIPWTELETLSRDQNGLGNRPELYDRGVAVDRDLTISHTDRYVLVLLAKRPGIRIGCDLTVAGSVSDAVCRRSFLESEQSSDAGTPEPEYRAQVWAVKETAYKAMNERQSFMALHWPTRKIDDHTFSCVDLDSAGKDELFVETWRYEDHVVAVAARETVRPEVRPTTGDRAADDSTFEPLAVIGYGCRFPDIDGPDEFWSRLASGDCVVSEIPPDRLDREFYVTDKKDVRGKCYATLAGIIETPSMEKEDGDDRPGDIYLHDKVHRTAFGVVVRALRHAGIDPSRMKERNAGIYIGATQDHDEVVRRIYSLGADATVRYLEEIPEFQALPESERRRIQEELLRTIHHRYDRPDGERDRKGRSAAVPGNLASNIAESLHVTGPAILLDAACASSLVALSLAARALHFGDIDVAIVGGASYLRFDNMIHFSHAQAASNQGSMPFDQKACGMIPGDGHAFVIVKTLEKARRDGDSIKGVIRGIGISSDGRGKSLWAPRKEGQVSAIRRAYAQCAPLTPGRLDYIEAHATSTQLGDATELQALEEAVAESLGPATRSTAVGEKKRRKITVGSVKANIGHCLEAAGIAGLIKVLLMFEREFIPRQINLETLTDKFFWRESSLQVLTENAIWDRRAEDTPLLAAVNAFGIGGLNAHVVLQEYLPGDHDKTIGRHDEKSPIAVVGMSCILPGAPNLDAYHELRKSGTDPKCAPNSDRWDLLFPDPVKAPRGGYLNDYQYDWKRHRIPPIQVAQGNPLQFMLLDAVEDALQCPGFKRECLPRETTGVVVGTRFESDFVHSLQMGIRLPEFEKDLAEKLRGENVSEIKTGRIVRAYRELFLKRHPAILDDSGSFTSSTLASRIAKTLDLGGGAVALDAGDCSSMAALRTAVESLRTGETDTVICAGAQRNIGRIAWENAANDPSAAPLAEGVIVFLLKRLDDAWKNGDKIHAVLHHVVSHRDDRPEKAEEISLRSVLKESKIDATDVILHEKSRPDTTGGGQALSVAFPAGRLGHPGGVAGFLALFDAVLALEELDARGNRGESTPLVSPRKDGRLFATVSNRDENGTAYAAVLERGEPVPVSEKEAFVRDGFKFDEDRVPTPPAVYQHCGRSPEERGRLFGARFADRIRTLLPREPLDRFDVMESWTRHPVFEDALRELRGIAGGAGVPLESIHHFVPETGCNRTELDVLSSWVFQVRRVAEEISHIYLGRPGRFGGPFGVNDRGLSIGVIREDSSDERTPSFLSSVVLRHLLSVAATIDEAEAALNPLIDTLHHSFEKAAWHTGMTTTFSLFEAAEGHRSTFRFGWTPQTLPLRRVDHPPETSYPMLTVENGETILLRGDRLYVFSPGKESCRSFEETVPGFVLHRRTRSGSPHHDEGLRASRPDGAFHVEAEICLGDHLPGFPLRRTI